MFSIDDVSLVLGIAMLLVSVLSPFANLLMARLKSDDREEDNGNPDDAREVQYDSGLPGVSVVLTVDDEGESLKANLAMWLSQSYGGDYQVIVVVSGNDSLVDNILKQYSDDKRLYTTFIPSSSRYMSRKKLAVTVGMKAAKYEWVLLSEVDCYPSSDKLVASFSKKCGDDIDIVLGYTAFEGDFRDSRRFDNTYNLYRQLAKAQRGRAWGYSGCALMLRKKVFIDGKGFDGNLKYARGEYEFLANKFSDCDNTAVFCSHEEMVVRQPLSDKGWCNKVLNYIAIRKTLQGSASARLLFNITMLSMSLCNICILALAVFSICTSRWVLLAFVCVSLLVSAALRMFVLSRSVRSYLGDMSILKMWMLEQTMPIRNAQRLLRYKSADKYDFISHSCKFIQLAIIILQHFRYIHRFWI